MHIVCDGCMCISVCLWRVKWFHQYLFQTQFTIVSDHKSLQCLFSESNATSVLALACIPQCMYDGDICLLSIIFVFNSPDCS